MRHTQEDQRATYLHDKIRGSAEEQLVVSLLQDVDDSSLLELDTYDRTLDWRALQRRDNSSTFVMYRSPLYHSPSLEGFRFQRSKLKDTRTDEKLHIESGRSEY